MTYLRGGLLLAACVALSACDLRDPIGATVAEPASLTLTAASSAVLTSLGDTAVVRSQVLDRAGTTLPSVVLRWTTIPAGIVQVDGEGIFRAIGNGRVVITAELDHAQTGVRPRGYWADRLADSVVVVVRQQPALLSIRALDTAFTTLGARRQLSAQVTDARGNALLEGPLPLSWRSSNPQVLSVDSAGVARSQAEGDARVVVHGGDLVGEASFTVRPRLPHTSCMVFAQRRRTQQSCVTLELAVREREDGR